MKTGQRNEGPAEPKPVPELVGGALQQLVSEGCDKEYLLRLLEAYCACSPKDVRGKGKRGHTERVLVGMGRTQEQVDVVLRDLNAAMALIESINNSVALQTTYTVTRYGIGPNPSHVRRKLRRAALLPEMLKEYVAFVEEHVSACEKVVFPRDAAAFLKWQIINYVRQVTGRPNLKLISELFYSYLDAKSPNEQVNDQRLNAEALRKFAEYYRSISPEQATYTFSPYFSYSIFEPGDEVEEG